MRLFNPPAHRWAFVIGLLSIAAICRADPGKILADDTDGRDWPAFGRGYGEQHFSPLTQINEANIGRLGLAWSLDLGPGNSVTGPLEIDGTLYFANGYSLVHAVDAATGRVKWVYDPHAPEASGRKLRLGWGSRGIAWWNGKIYTGTQDGRLIALDAVSGRPLWTVMTVDKEDYRFISGPPRAFDGKVIIGHGGADSSDVRGYVTAYDADTGRQLWRFYTVPGDPHKPFESKAMAMAAKTWSGHWWDYGGGGTVWNAITYDAALHQIYLGTGNGAPWNHHIRSAGHGDNLFLCSIVALDADTGAYKWHYQTNPAESWDYNAAMDMELADLPIGGRSRPVLMTAPKNGFFYVIDRKSGKLISAKPYVPVSWATGIDLKTGRPQEVPGIRYGGQDFTMTPSTFGAHNWLPMAFDPGTNLVFIPATELSASFSEKGVTLAGWKRSPDNVLDEGTIANIPLDQGATSALVAWDPVTQSERWRVPTPGFWNGGVVATAGGLVFQGHMDSSFNGYATKTGQLLWHFDAGAPVIAPPISYGVAGKQYVTVLTGMGGTAAYLGPLLEKFGLNPATQARRVLTFALDGAATLPPSDRQPTVVPAVENFNPDQAADARGLPLFGQRCAVCHGMNAIAVGAAPDLRASPITRSDEAFRSVVHDGTKISGGMPQFDELNDTQLADMRHYILSQALKANGRQPR